MKQWVDFFGENLIDLDDDIEKNVEETFDFSSFGRGEAVTEALVWGGH